MKIIDVKLSDLKPYENNPRFNGKAVDKVAASIKTFGFKVPLVIDKDYVIVCGHTRYEASQKLGLDSVPCVMADDLTPAQIKAYRLADNKVSESSDWDFEALEQELNAIDTDALNGLTMSDFGFDETQANITDDFDDVNAFDDDNDEQDVKQKDTLVRIGEYRFNLERDEYLTLIKDIQLRYGFTKDDIIKGLKDRLCS